MCKIYDELFQQLRFVFGVWQEPLTISWLISPVCARKEAVDPVFLVLLKSIEVFRAIVKHKNGICRNGLYGLFQLVPFFE